MVMVMMFSPSLVSLKCGPVVTKQAIKRPGVRKTRTKQFVHRSTSKQGNDNTNCSVPVRLDRVSNDGYKSCRGFRIYSQALLWNSASCRRRVRALRSLSDLSLALSSNVTTLNHLIRLQGSQGIQIWKQRSHSTPLYMCFIDLQKAHDSVHRGCCVLCLHASVCRRRC